MKEALNNFQSLHYYLELLFGAAVLWVVGKVGARLLKWLRSSLRYFKVQEVRWIVETRRSDVATLHEAAKANAWLTTFVVSIVLYTAVVAWTPAQLSAIVGGKALPMIVSLAPLMIVELLWLDSRDRTRRLLAAYARRWKGRRTG